MIWPQLKARIVRADDLVRADLDDYSMTSTPKDSFIFALLGRKKTDSFVAKARLCGRCGGNVLVEGNYGAGLKVNLPIAVRLFQKNNDPVRACGVAG